MDKIQFTRIKHDVNGNPRLVCHFLNFIVDSDHSNGIYTTSSKYDLALSRARKIGGKKFHNQQYGGGIVFQAYSEDALQKDIEKLMVNY